MDGCMLIVRFNSVKVLSNVIRDADDVLPQRDLSGQQKKDLGEITRGCHDVLNQLKENLDKNQELVGSKVKGISGKSRRMWKRFQWDQAEIDQFRNRICLNITAFSIFLGRITRCHLSLLVVEKLGAYLSQQCVFCNKGRCRSAARATR